MIKDKKIIVKDIIGTENLSGLKTGAIMTCNHFNAYDSFAIQMAYEASISNWKKKRFYRVIKEANYTSFPGFYGFLMRHCYTLPLSSSPKAMGEMMKSVDTLLKEGHLVLVYPEQSMWWNYRKPKPLKKGAYRFAVKSNVPIVPCFITMQDSNIVDDDGFKVQEYTIHIENLFILKKGCLKVIIWIIFLRKTIVFGKIFMRQRTKLSLSIQLKKKYVLKCNPRFLGLFFKIKYYVLLIKNCTEVQLLII